MKLNRKNYSLNISYYEGFLDQNTVASITKSILNKLRSLKYCLTYLELQNKNNDDCYLFLGVPLICIECELLSINDYKQVQSRQLLRLRNQ